MTECDTNTDSLSTNEFNVKKSLENKLVYKNGDNLTQNKNQDMADKIKEADEIELLIKELQSDLAARLIEKLFLTLLKEFSNR